MANFKVKNGLQAGRYLLSGGTETAGSVVYNLAGGSYDGVSLNVSSQDGAPRNILFNADGTKMYVLGSNNDSAYQYTLTTAYDLSTASYDNVSFSFVDDIPSGFSFSGDGTKLYVAGGFTDTVYQYSLSTAYDLSTTSYDGVSLDVSSLTSSLEDVAFNSDGTKMFLVVSNLDNVYQYSLSTAFDLSTASYDSVSFYVGAQEANPRCLVFSGDGTKMFICGNSNSTVFEYNLSTAFAISTASYSGNSYNLSSDGALFGFAFNDAGTKLYTAEITTDTIRQHTTGYATQTLDLSTGTTFSFTPSGATTVSLTNPPATGNAIGFSVEVIGDGSAITWPTSVKWHEATAPTATASKELYAFITTDGGTTYYGKKVAEEIA